MYVLDHDHFIPLSFPSFKVDSDVKFHDVVRHTHVYMR